MRQAPEIRADGTSVAATVRIPGHAANPRPLFFSPGRLIIRADDIAEIIHRPDLDPEGIANTPNARLLTKPGKR